MNIKSLKNLFYLLLKYLSQYLQYNTISIYHSPLLDEGRPKINHV